MLSFWINSPLFFKVLATFSWTCDLKRSTVSSSCSCCEKIDTYFYWQSQELILKISSHWHEILPSWVCYIPCSISYLIILDLLSWPTEFHSTNIFLGFVKSVSLYLLPLMSFCQSAFHILYELYPQLMNII